MAPDVVNALFEAGGALAILLSLRRLLRDKKLAGYDPATLAFFTAWGFWNLFFYPAVGASWSFFAGIAVVASNLAYLAAMAWFSRPARERRAIVRRAWSWLPARRVAKPPAPRRSRLLS